jgi:hypothetical protein
VCADSLWSCFPVFQLQILGTRRLCRPIWSCFPVFHLLFDFPAIVFQITVRSCFHVRVCVCVCRFTVFGLLGSPIQVIYSVTNTSSWIYCIPCYLKLMINGWTSYVMARSIVHFYPLKCILNFPVCYVGTYM